MTAFNLFNLPEWARWCGLIDFNNSLLIQVAALEYPRWGGSYFPVFCEQSGSQIKPLYPFPADLTKASRDNHIWFTWPTSVKYDPKTKQVILNCHGEEDQMSPAWSQRLLCDPPLYEARSTEYLTSRGGNGIPDLIALSPGLIDGTYYFFDKKPDFYTPTSTNLQTEENRLIKPKDKKRK